MKHCYINVQLQVLHVNNTCKISLHDTDFANYLYKHLCQCISYCSMCIYSAKQIKLFNNLLQIKKSQKRKTEGELPETKKQLKIKVEEDESIEVKKSLKRKADDKEIFDVRKSIKRKLNEELRPSLEPSISGQIQPIVEQRPAKQQQQQKKESTSEEMLDLTNSRKLSSDALTYCYNVLLNMIEDQPDEVSYKKSLCF